MPERANYESKITDLRLERLNVSPEISPMKLGSRAVRQNSALLRGSDWVLKDQEHG